MTVPAEKEGLFTNPAAEQIGQLINFRREKNINWRDLTDTDWDELLSYALWYGLAPLCYIKLITLELESIVPKGILHLFHQAYIEEAAIGIKRRYEISQLAKAFRDENISLLLLKGAHLSETIYQDPGLRKMVDLDLMVHKRDLRKASQKLEEEGYSPSKHFNLDLETAISHQLPMYIKSNHTPIELHWTLLHPEFGFNLDIERIWERSQTIVVGGIEVQTLSAEDLLLHLALHTAAQHKLTGGLRLVYDFAAALNKLSGQINWDVFVERCTTWRANAAVFLILQLTDRILGVAAPSGIADKIRPLNFDDVCILAGEELVFINKKFSPGFSRNLAMFVEFEGHA